MIRKTDNDGMAVAVVATLSAANWSRAAGRRVMAGTAPIADQADRYERKRNRALSC